MSWCRTKRARKPRSARRRRPYVEEGEVELMVVAAVKEAEERRNFQTETTSALLALGTMRTTLRCKTLDSPLRESLILRLIDFHEVLFWPFFDRSFGQHSLARILYSIARWKALLIHFQKIYGV